MKLTESSAINRYIINRSAKKELLGKDIKDQALVDNILGVFNDIRSSMSPVYFSENFAS